VDGNLDGVDYISILNRSRSKNVFYLYHSILNKIVRIEYGSELFD
jgi:hypothetical protein